MELLCLGVCKEQAQSHAQLLKLPRIPFAPVATSVQLKKCKPRIVLTTADTMADEYTSSQDVPEGLNPKVEKKRWHTLLRSLWKLGPPIQQNEEF